MEQQGDPNRAKSKTLNINKRTIKKGGREMETKDMAKKGLYVGTGAGLVLFALVGLLPGSLIGGVIGLKVIGSIFGSLSSAILPRLLLAVSMIMGVLVSATVCLLGSGMIGYSVGFLMDSVGQRAAVATPATAKK